MIDKKYLSQMYDCSEYLKKYDKGYVNDDKKLQLILSYEDISIDSEHKHLVIGQVGSDEIELCFRIHKAGIWAFYRSEVEYKKVSTSIELFIKDWESDSIEL